jgi:hypothetical protein
MGPTSGENDITMFFRHEMNEFLCGLNDHVEMELVGQSIVKMIGRHMVVDGEVFCVFF